MTSDLEKAVEIYGGLKLWNRLDHVLLRMVSLGGPLPKMKGLGKTFSQMRLTKVFPRHGRAEFLDYPEPGSKVVFDNGRVGFSEAPAENYRDTFSGLKKHRRWSPLDASYFFGYAITTYLSIPFVLDKLATRVRPWGDGFRVAARFPASIHTHSKNQEFFFNEHGLLVRHDYTADVVSRLATGSHFTSDYQKVDGLPIATSRKVYARIGSIVTPIPVLEAKLEPLSAHFD